MNELPSTMGVRSAILMATDVITTVKRSGDEFVISIPVSVVKEYKNKIKDVAQQVALLLDGFKPKGVTYKIVEE